MNLVPIALKGVDGSFVMADEYLWQGLALYIYIRGSI
jgi:hypothetical protein